jgi:hypothetical protein
MLCSSGAEYQFYYYGEAGPRLLSPLPLLLLSPLPDELSSNLPPHYLQQPRTTPFPCVSPLFIIQRRSIQISTQTAPGWSRAPRTGMSRQADRCVGAAAAFSAPSLKAPPLPAQHPLFCRLQQNAKEYSRKTKKAAAAASSASSAPINPDFLQLMRAKMIKAFINSETEHKMPPELPDDPPPSLDRVLLHRATLKSRKLHLFSGEARAAQPHTANAWHDPILVTCPLHPPRALRSTHATP